MSGHYTVIQENEMRSFLESQGFTEVKLDKTVEIVYSRVVAKQTCLRIYTSIAHGQGRECGTDAIRVCLVYRRKGGEIVGIGRDTRVNRIETWKANLQKRLDNYQDTLFTPPCQLCGEPTREREGKFGKFYGCCTYPTCKGITKIQ